MFQPRAREWNTSHLSWSLLDTHVAQLIWSDVRNEQVRASDQGEHEQTNYYGDYEHRILLSIASVPILTTILQESSSPNSTVKHSPREGFSNTGASYLYDAETWILFHFYIRFFARDVAKWWDQCVHSIKSVVRLTKPPFEIKFSPHEISRSGGIGRRATFRA